MPYLDKDGLTTLWAKVKNTFALKSHSHTASEVETKADGTYITSGETVDESLYYLDKAIASGGGSGAVSGVKGNAESSYRTGQVNLTAANIGAAAESHTHAAGDITSGTLSAARGGTGQTTLQATRNAMGLGNTTGALPIANGGTGSTTAANARSALGITCSNIGAATSSHTHSGAAAANDYVTAQGASSSWYYRKWNSGKKECWRMYSFTTGTMTASGSVYYYEAALPAYPWTWSSLQNLQLTAYCQYPMWCAENSTNRTTSHPGNITVFRTNAANSKTVYVMMYAWGW